ncbi:hypothetical protein PB2503_10284 [Parvularcula bermudensis HTCC2503]|uniref:Uncharacterized protein n=2 Tax=Parvularcula TaxID=208215 RepID=E0TFY9_PARBH|nr:hypothetical protein PB2503_10284 [Parvularcula bermudensis HTCC2503]
MRGTKTNHTEIADDHIRYFVPRLVSLEACARIHGLHEVATHLDRALICFEQAKIRTEAGDGP